MEPLPAGARVPPSPPRPPAPPTTGSIGRPAAGGPSWPSWRSELRKVVWPTPAALAHNTALVLGVVVVLAVLLAAVG